MERVGLHVVKNLIPALRFRTILTIAYFSQLRHTQMTRLNQVMKHEASKIL